MAGPRNTLSLPQYPRMTSAQLATANTSYTSPTNVALMIVAGPDGTQCENMSAVPTATVSTANQLQFFQSPDGGTTFNLLPFGAVMATYTMAQTTAYPATSIVMPNGLPIGPSNPFYMSGLSDYEALSYAQSTLSEPTTTFYGGKSFGTVNAQTLPYCFNESGTILPASPATGTIVDFEAGLTNTTTTTVAPGLQGATAIKRNSATQLSAGDLTVGFRYRMVFDGTEWILGITNRLYAAQGQAQATCFTAWYRDF